MGVAAFVVACTPAPAALVEVTAAFGDVRVITPFFDCTAPMACPDPVPVDCPALPRAAARPLDFNSALLSDFLLLLSMLLLRAALVV